MTARDPYICTASPAAIARRVLHAQTMIEKVHPGQVTVTEDHPAKEDRDGSTMSHWRYLLDENGRQYRIQAVLFSPSYGEGTCRVFVEVGGRDTYAEVALTLDQSKDFMLVSALNVIAEINEGGEVR